MYKSQTTVIQTCTYGAGFKYIFASGMIGLTYFLASFSPFNYLFLLKMTKKRGTTCEKQYFDQ